MSKTSKISERVWMKFFIFKDPGLQIDDAIILFDDLELSPDGITEGTVKGITGRYFLFIQNVKQKVAAGSQIGIYIPEYLIHVGQAHNMVQGIAGAGDQVKLSVRAVDGHVGCFKMQVGEILPGDTDHAFGKIGSPGINAVALENVTEDTRAAA